MNLFLYLRRLLASSVCALLAACSALPGSQTADPISASAWARACRMEAEVMPAASSWHNFRLPGKAATEYTAVRVDGRDALMAQSVASASMLRYKMRVEPKDLSRLAFSWKVLQLIPEADMAVRDTEDSPARVVLAFDGDRSRLTGRNLMMSELARALTGEEMPYATLMYVWANEARVDSVIINPRTDRIRKIVVESGGLRLNQWLNFERNIRADYEKAYGEPPGALIGVGVMTDSDNTGTTAKAWYGPIRLAR